MACKYCTESWNRVDLCYMDGWNVTDTVEVYPRGYLHFEHDCDDDYYRSRFDIDIEYCPMCGQKLGTED